MPSSPGPVGFTRMALRMTLGFPIPGWVTRTMLALYPPRCLVPSLPVRRIRDFVIGFLQIPPRGGHPCLDGWFRSLRSIGDSHPRNAYHYSTHQAECLCHDQLASYVAQAFSLWERG